MSKSWARGSTRAWRRIRAQVLARDGYTCRLKLPGCTTVANHVHHTLGKEYGDDPAFLIASCAHCNTSYGSPLKRRDPAPRPSTRWSD